MTDYQRQQLTRTLSRLRSKIKRFRESGDRIGEENTKATLIEPLLAALGWDIEEPDEVHREYHKKPQDSPVDYALCTSRTPHLFVEAKSLEKNLDDRRWASQIIAYATVVGVEWCVLTNGDEYRLYNAHAPVDVEEKLFRRVVLSDPATHETTEDTLDLLSKPRLRERRLTELWNAHHVDRRVQSVIERLWSKPDPAFMRLIRKHAKRLAPKDIKASLQRCRVKIDFPVEPLDARRKRKPAGRKRTGKRRAASPGLPSQTALEVPLLQEIQGRGGRIQLRTQFDEVANALADKFSLTPEQTGVRTQRGRTTIWKNRLQWVRQHLITNGELDGSERGVWRLTSQGRARASSQRKGALKLVDPA